jgi:glycerol-3-phosphate acyltransferase PlsY
MYIIAFIIFYKHIPNIIRIIKGEEKKVIWK